MKTRTKKKKPVEVKTETRAEEVPYKGPYGFEHPDAFDVSNDIQEV